MFGSKVLLRAYDVAVQPVRGVGDVRVKVLTFRAFDVAVQPMRDVGCIWSKFLLFGHFKWLFSL